MMKKRCLGCMETYSAEFNICPFCGYVEGTGIEEPIHMQPGSLLHDRYIIGKVLGYGGFGVTYIAWDGKLQQKVAIKEYLPGEFSTRMPGNTRVTVLQGEKGEQFYDGMRKFVDEARRLAKFQSEDGIVRIFDSFVENETAYIIMEYLDGMTLKEYLEQNGVIPEDQAVAMLMPIMNSLKVVHEAGLLHRDIAPDNIFITKRGEIKLIDFGASRYATTSHSRSLTVIIKPGYSPEEQYRSRGDQGTYTDVYALAATLYKMITGKTPPDAMERRSKYEQQSKDIIIEPHKLNKKISVNRENAILNAMNVRIEDRTQNIEAFIEELESEKPAKRRYGKIKKIDVLSWPLWLKILVPVLVVAVISAGIWVAIKAFDKPFDEERSVLEGYTEVPYVVDKTEDEARKLIADKELKYMVESSVVSEFLEPGKILYQDPPGGSEREKNTIVKVKLARPDDDEMIVEEVDGTITIHSFRGMTEDEARQILETEGIEYEIVEEYNNEIPKGSVISQDKEGKVKEGEKITLTVSKGTAPFNLADITGKTEAEAINILQDNENVAKRLVVSVEYRNDNNVQEGTVISQNPASGTMVSAGDTVTIIVSSGKEIVTVPSVVGKTKGEAEKALKDKGFTVETREEYSSGVAKGNVISVVPGEGTAQVYGSKVVLHVSKGKMPVTVTYDANGGKVSTSSATKYYGDTYGTLPVPTREGYQFLGWYTASNGGSKVTSSTKITVAQNHTLYAHWSAGNYTVTFDAKGGTVDISSVKIDFGDTYILANAQKTGYSFDYWYLSDGTRINNKSTVKIAADHTLYAHWTAKKYIVSFDSAGGTAVDDLTVEYNSTYSGLKTPTRSGYTFGGWYTASSGGSKVTSSTKVTRAENHTLYARWTAKSYTLTFDANGGSVSTTQKSLAYGAQYGSLPTPTRSHYTFDGWYTAKSGGSKVSSTTTMPANNVTVYAHWTIKPYTVSWSNPTGCTITVKRTSSPEAGKATGTLSSGQNVYYGDVLSITYTASSGYSISSKGASSITVKGNVTSDDIYATASKNSYTYNIKYVSTNGTNLGSSTATYAYGTSNKITPPSKSGYKTPSAQTVAWDSETPKTITFKYEPESVAFTEKSGTHNTQNHSKINYKATVEYRNRTKDSVEIRVKWTDSLVLYNGGTSAYNAYSQNFNVKIGSKKSSDICVVKFNEWGSSSSATRTKTAYSEWIKVPLSTTNKTSVDVTVNHWQENANGTKFTDATNMTKTWSVAIPAY